MTSSSPARCVKTARGVIECEMWAAHTLESKDAFCGFNRTAFSVTNRCPGYRSGVPTLARLRGPRVLGALSHDFCLHHSLPFVFVLFIACPRQRDILSRTARS